MGMLACAQEFDIDAETLVFDNGDTLQGSAFGYYCATKLHSPAPIAQAFIECGYHVATAGNHDFNYGWRYLADYVTQLRKGGAAFVCQNITDAAGKALFPPVVLTTGNGVKVGVAGAVTDWVNVWEQPENLVGIKVSDPFEALRQAADELRGRCDIMVCLYHGGYERDTATGAVVSKTNENVGYRICEELDFDLLLCGHQHNPTPGRLVQGTFTIQPGEYGRQYCHLELVEHGSAELAAGRRWEVSLSELVTPRSGISGLSAPEPWVLAAPDAPTSSNIVANPRVASVARALLPLENDLQNWLDKPVGQLSYALKPDTRERMAANGSPIADFVNQVQLAATGAEVAVSSLANEIAGFNTTVTTRDILATYPYANTLLTLQLTGAELKAAIERSAEYLTLDAAGNLAVSAAFLVPKIEHYSYDFFAGIDYAFDISLPPGKRVTRLARWDGTPIAPDDHIRICLNNYRASGAGEYPMYVGKHPLAEITVSMSELLLEYFATHSDIELKRLRPERLAYGF
jgi:2',3'-cyclic-nucleotide 2'-phosphodiesterase/3'-nucleotidase